MAAAKRVKTKYPGVFYRETERLGGSGTEKVYYILFKKHGKLIEEKAGRQFADDMTPAKASSIRSERLEGKRSSRKEIRAAEIVAREAEKAKCTIGDIWSQYQILRSTKKSLITDRYNFNNHLLSFCDLRPEDIATIDIQKLRNHLEGKNLSPASVKHILVLLRMLINWGVKQGFCQQPDLSRLQFDIPVLDNERTESLTLEQLAAYENALDKEIDQNLAALFRLALVTGMRKTALMNLRWDDCDFDGKTILLRGEVAKKGKSERIPMSDLACTILMGIEKKQSDYIFPGRDGGPRKELRRMAQRVKKHAGLPKNFRPLHGLRHTYASFLISSGRVDLYTLQKLLTHSSPKMTQRYAHLADAALRRAANVVDEIFKEKRDY